MSLLTNLRHYRQSRRVDFAQIVISKHNLVRFTRDGNSNLLAEVQELELHLQQSRLKYELRCSVEEFGQVWACNSR